MIRNPIMPCYAPLFITTCASRFRPSNDGSFIEFRPSPGAKDVFKDQKEGGGGGGYYWPVPAVWKSGGAEDPEFHQNGVYLSHLAAMVFTGKKIATKVRRRKACCRPSTLGQGPQLRDRPPIMQVSGVALAPRAVTQLIQCS